MRLFFTLILLVLLATSSEQNQAYAHSGGLNASGCHGGSRPYHCHRAASEMVRTSTGHNRLRCAAGSRSQECRGSTQANTITRVLNLQIQLKRHCSGLPPNFADGKNGPTTERVLRAFQAAYGLQVDGTYGPQTQTALSGSPNGRCDLRPKPQTVIATTQPSSTKPEAQSISSNTALTAVKTRVETLRAEEKALLARIKATKKRASTISTKLTSLETEKQQAQTQIATMLERLGKLKAKETITSSFLSNFSTEYEEKSIQLSELEMEITNAVGRIGTLVDKQAQLTGNIAANENAFDLKLQAKKAELEQIQRLIVAKSSSLTEFDQRTTQPESENVSSSFDQAEKWNKLTSTTAPPTRARELQEVEVSTPLATVTPSATEQHSFQPEKPVHLRNQSIVKTAILRAPGLDLVSKQKTDQLTSALIGGQCINEALNEVFGRVNPHTFVSLLKDMELCAR